MKLVSVVAFYTTSFAIACLFRKCIAMSQQLFFEVSLLWFHFAFALWCFYHNEYSVKQSASLYLELPLKPAFYSVFLLFLKR